MVQFLSSRFSTRRKKEDTHTPPTYVRTHHVVGRIQNVEKLYSKEKPFSKTKLYLENTLLQQI